MISQSVKNIEFALKILKTTGDQMKTSSAIAKRLAKEGCGHYEKGIYQIDARTRAVLKDWLKSLGIDWTKKFDRSASRTELSKSTALEKTSREVISTNWVKIRPLTRGCFIGDLEILLPPGSHLMISIEELSKLRVDSLIVVENLESFLGLEQMQFEEKLSCAMAIYRGDPSESKTISVSRVKTILSQSIELIPYSDLDPAGIDISLTMKTDRIILPNLAKLEHIEGNKKLYTDQLHQLIRHEDRGTIPDKILPWVDFIKKNKAGYVQERFEALKISLQIIML